MNPRYLLRREMDEPQNQSARCGEEKNLSSAWYRIPVVKAVADSYTDWALSTPIVKCVNDLNISSL
jgi:hypothetical protein